MKITIGVDAFPLKKLHGGVSYYIFHLLDELIQLRPECHFFLYTDSDKGDLQYFHKYKNVSFRIIPYLNFSHSLWRQTSLALALFRDDIDYFWGSTQSIPLIKRMRLKTLFTLYDFAYEITPNAFPFLFRLYFKMLMPAMLSRADYILPISQGTAERLKQIYGMNHEVVVHPPIKPGFNKKQKDEIEKKLSSYGLIYNQYVITVGTIEPRKNFEQLINVFIKILEKYPFEKITPLVIIGDGGWKNQKLKELLYSMQKKYPDKIKHLGYVPDRDLADYLSGARYYVTLSHYEGYCMPIAEARVCGTRIVSFDQMEFREAAENDGIFLDHSNLESDLEKCFLLLECYDEKKAGFKVDYLSNREKAAMISDLIVNDKS